MTMFSDAVDNARKARKETIKAGRNVWLAGLGAVAYADEEARGLFDRLVNKGETFEKEDRFGVGKAVDKAGSEVRDFGQKIESGVQDTVGGVLHRAGVPTQEEIRILIDRVEKLTAKVEALG